MNSGQRLYVTPEERAMRMAAQQQNASRHPHGGEGNCGGNEGHGTPELLRRHAESQRSAGKVNTPRGTSAQSADPNHPRAPEANAAPSRSDAKPASKTVSPALAPSREQLAYAMKLSFALGEPACRRYGLRSPYQRKGF